MKLALLRALFSLCLLFASTARAETAATLVVLIADDPADAVVARLERDLRGLGFGVMVLAATPENANSDAALEHTARSLGGMATVRVLALGQGSQLWVLEPTTGRSVTRALTLPAGSTPDVNEVALGTLELLRASMLELHPPVPAPSSSAATPPASPPPTAAACPRESSPVFSVAGGAGVELGLHSFGPSVMSVWAAWLKVRGPWGVRGFSALPLTSERGRVPEGTVEVRPTLIGAGFTLGQGLNDWWLEPRASWGVSLAHVETHGVASDPRTSSSGSVWLAGGYALLGAALRLTRDVRLDLDLTGVVLSAPAIILVNQREEASWGAPAGMASLSVEVFATR